MGFRNKELNQDTFIKTDSFCPLCKWELIDCCANFTNVVDLHGEYIGDYFMYCGNKSCENHKGVFYSQENPIDLLKTK